MGILPKILEDTDNEQESTSLESGNVSYIVDFKNKKMRYNNGKPLLNDYELAAKMYIQKLLLTELKQWRYHTEYGTNYKELTLGKKYSDVVNRIEIETNLKEQLLNYPTILSVNRLKIYQKYKTLIIEFSVLLKEGKIVEWKEEIVI